MVINQSVISKGLINQYCLLGCLIGTDIGGSIRGPAAFCGIYGFKPTSYVLPTRGVSHSPFPAELNILSSIGPMSRSLRDMDHFVKNILSTKPHLLDSKLVPLPWTGLQTPLNRRLKIGIIEDDGFIQPQPPIKRAIAWARELLCDPKNANILEVKSFKPYGAAESLSMVKRMYFPNGSQYAKAALAAAGEPVHHLSEWVLKEAGVVGMQTADAVAQMRLERDEFRYAFAKSWLEQDVDVVIGPAYVGPASVHDTAYYWSYTSLYNLVDYPGVAFPTPIQTIDGEKYGSDYIPMSDACKHVKDLWDSSSFKDAPINLQLVGRKYHDSELFGALAVLKDILNLV